jgi:hypothetical protein
MKSIQLITYKLFAFKEDAFAELDLKTNHFVFYSNIYYENH